ncbi:MAG: tetratricopeptide repeat protein, partial [Rhodobacterales bacterium]|nr:tetratricopeptide repeat protein [Rhodobacterales bacterium]
MVVAVEGESEELIAAARAAVAAGAHDAALSCWQELLALHPDNQAEALCGMAEAQLALENYDEALDHVAALTAVDPGYGPLRHLRARILGQATLRVSLRLVPLEIVPGFRVAIPDGTLIRRELQAVPLRVRLRGAAGATGTLVLENMDGTRRHHPLAAVDAMPQGRIGPRALWRRLRGGAQATLRVDLRRVRRIGIIPHGAPAEGGTVWTHDLVSAEVPTCLEGKEGWLFLTNDGNRSDAIFTGQVQLAPWRRLAWMHYAWRLARATRVLRTQGVKLVFVIAPSKETVMPQFYPLRRGARNLSATVTAILQRAKIPLVFPVARLAATPGSYCRTDTHWSHAGAFAALEACLDQFGLQGDWRARIDFVPLEVMGDLGGKMTPAVTDEMLVARWPGQDRAQVLYRSGLATTGEIVIFDNPDAPVQEVLVVFGGSSASTLAYLASRIFRRVVRVNCPSTQPVMEVIADEGAAYVICQTNERYLQRA